MRSAREMALNLLFQVDVAKIGLDDAVRTASENAQVAPESFEIGVELARGAWDYATEADRIASALAPEWPSERQPSVDRNILRLALYEMDRVGTPSSIVMDEAIELAKLYSTAESAKFVNGVLEGARAKEASRAGAGRGHNGNNS